MDDAPVQLPHQKARIDQAEFARWTAALVGVNLLWRAVRYGVGFPIWGDEAFVAVNFIERDFLGLTRALEHGQIVPLLFLWVEWIIGRAIGYSEYALRFVPFMAGIASVFLFWRFARRTVPKLIALLALGVFAASYYPVRHSAEIKPYSVDLLVSLILLVLAWRCFLRPRAIRRWIWLTVAAVFSVWASYPAVFIAGGAAVALAPVVRRERSVSVVTSWLIYSALLAASFAAMYLTVGRAQAAAGEFLLESGHWKFTFPPITEPWLLPEWFFLVHAGNMFAYPTGGNDGGSIVTFLLFVIGCVSLWRRGRRDLLFLLLAPLLLMFIAAALKKYPYGGSARVTLHLAPAICLLTGAGLLAVFRTFFRGKGTVDAMRIFLGAMIVFAVIGIARDVIEPYKNVSDRENRRVVSMLMAKSRPEDRWIVFGDFGRKEHVPNLYGWGGTASQLRFNLARFSPSEIVWGPNPADISPRESGITRLLVYRDNNAAFPFEQFKKYLAALTNRLGEPVSHDHYWLGEAEESIDVYRFE